MGNHYRIELDPSNPRKALTAILSSHTEFTEPQVWLTFETGNEVAADPAVDTKRKEVLDAITGHGALKSTPQQWGALYEITDKKNRMSISDLEEAVTALLGTLGFEEVSHAKRIAAKSGSDLRR